MFAHDFHVTLHITSSIQTLDNTSKILLDKLLNKVCPADPGIKSPVCQECITSIKYMRDNQLRW